jgi:arsenite methyltransferase
VVVGVGDPQDMAAMPVTRHGFHLRPVQEIVSALGEAGLRLVAHERVGPPGNVDHLLVCERHL